MQLSSLFIAPSANFWRTAARELLDARSMLLPDTHHSRAMDDLSSLRVVVPTYMHAQSLRTALDEILQRPFIAPRLCTLTGWLALQAPNMPRADTASSGNERLMMLYAELRKHGWLKKLFSARRNTDLLPLSQTLMALADELSMALLPAMEMNKSDAQDRWDAALAQLPPTARAVLSEESQLVWSVWKSQLDDDDPLVSRFRRTLDLAAKAQTPLVWISPIAPDPCIKAFLDSWALRRPVLTILLDWRAEALSRISFNNANTAPEPLGQLPGQLSAILMSQAWPELIAAPFSDETNSYFAAQANSSCRLMLAPAADFEKQAQHCAQTIVDWLHQGMSNIAIVAQDRVASRRLRALLQRAQVEVADETGWKLSTTRAAATIVAWFDVVASRAETTVLLDFLKSPFLLTESTSQSDDVMAIEIALRRANVAGGWRAVLAVVPPGRGRDHLLRLAHHAATFQAPRSIVDWLALTKTTFASLGLTAAFAQDAAGQQICDMFDTLGRDCAGLPQEFSFSEWRAYVSLQLESVSFLPPQTDHRVVMLALNGTHLRDFEAVIVVGADTTHLPSASNETLFFANAVRRELGLNTRESRQLQQLRDFAELLMNNRLVVLSWQAYRDGEPNPKSNWVARLELHLALRGLPPLPVHEPILASCTLTAMSPVMPAPAAAALLPKKLSASGYGSLTACPYQFFATRMLGLSGMEELSQQPEKRDYGDWLHQILEQYHSGVRDQSIAVSERAAFLQMITKDFFDQELTKSAAALGYYDRWQKAMPAYLEWANAREAEGWQFVLGEVWRERTLRWEGGEVLLHGRLDRIDQIHNADFGTEMRTEVLDYKANTLAVLKKRIESGEDHQLAFYGLLTETSADSAAYVSLEPYKGKITSIAAPDYPRRREDLAHQIGAVMRDISRDVGLPASGIESTCRYCEVRGLCRKGAW